MENESYIGVSYHPRDRFYLPRVKYKGKYYWLKAWPTAYQAAQVRDVAARWMMGSRTILNNFPAVDLPEGVTEAHIARWLLEAGIPLRLLAYRIPAPVLIEAGVTAYELLQAGVTARILLQFATNPS